MFFGRFILGLRTWASWLAGANHMRWRTFFLWNALGGICWATAVGLIAYYVGQSASNAITTFGIYGLVAVVVALGGAFVLHRRHRRQQRTHQTAAESKASANAPPRRWRPPRETQPARTSRGKARARLGNAP